LLFHWRAPVVFVVSASFQRRLALHSTRLITESAGTRETLRSARISLRDEMMQEVCHQLAPFRTDDDAPLTDATVIYKDLSIDSLAVMDVILELEDRFDVSIPINTVAEIHTVRELVDAMLALRARH
jgi:acyl carrier protein